MAGNSEGEGMEEDVGEDETKREQPQQQAMETREQSELEEEEAPTAGEASLLRGFDQIYQEYRELVTEVQTVRARCSAEAMKREALEMGYSGLKQDNERLKKLHTETLIKFAHQFECHSKCVSLKEELNEAERNLINMKAEHEKAIEKLQQEHHMKVADFEKQISCFMLQISTNETTINQLQQELSGHKKRAEALNKHLNRVVADTELQYQREIQELRDWIMVEQEEKNGLLKKLRNAETELLVTKTKQAEQLRESISIRHVETLKQKIMKLRKENETLKRQPANSDSADPQPL